MMDYPVIYLLDVLKKRLSEKGERYMEGKMTLRIVNRQQETITSSNFIADTYQAATIKPIGTLLISFLELEINNQESFNVFIKKWGIGGFEKFSKTAIELYNSKKLANIENAENDMYQYPSDEWDSTTYRYHEELDKNLLVQILKESQGKLRRAQAILNDMVYYVLDANGPEWAHGLTPRQRFYIYQKLRKDKLHTLHLVHVKNLITDFETNFRDQSLNDFNKGAHINTEKELAKIVKDKEIDILELYTSGDIVAICYVEIKEMIANSTIVKKCQRCGLYFIPTKRIDEEYCDRTVKILPNGTKKTCKDVGPTEKYLDNLKNDPILEAYKRTYKSMHARLKAKGKSRISQSGFFTWKNDAENKMQEVRQSKISFETYIDWLKNGGVE